MIALLQRVLIYGTLAVGLVWVGHKLGLVGLHYPRWVDNQPLREPIAIAEIRDRSLVLEDGRVLNFKPRSVSEMVNCRRENLEALFAEAPRTIEIQRDGGGGMVSIAYPAELTRCFTPWASQGFIIPLIAAPVPRIQRGCLAFGPEAHLISGTDAGAVAPAPAPAPAVGVEGESR